MTPSMLPPTHTFQLSYNTKILTTNNCWSETTTAKSKKSLHLLTGLTRDNSNSYYRTICYYKFRFWFNQSASEITPDQVALPRDNFGDYWNRFLQDLWLVTFTAFTYHYHSRCDVYLLLIIHHALQVVDNSRLKVLSFLLVEPRQFLANCLRHFFKVFLVLCNSLLQLPATSHSIPSNLADRNI